jgi:hypothetical protein
MVSHPLSRVSNPVFKLEDVSDIFGVPRHKRFVPKEEFN